MESTTSTFIVTGMTCGHCASAVTQEVSKLAHVTNVEVDLATGAVRVESHGPIDVVAFAAAIDEAGYELAP